MDKERKKWLEEEGRLKKEINEAIEEMTAALERFENVIEPELVDYYSYFYKASEAKYSYLNRKIKAFYKNIK